MNNSQCHVRYVKIGNVHTKQLCRDDITVLVQV